MFTGIVEEKGEVRAFAKEERAWRLRVAAKAVLDGLTIGDSVAVNGCCLTVVEIENDELSFDLLEETVQRTSFQRTRPGDFANLEASLRFNGKIGGHFVTGHIDEVGEVEIFEPRGADYYLRVRVPAGFERYLIYKGSIAIDGVSLTVAEVQDPSLAVWLIPHTLAITTLGMLRPGSLVNLEFDLLGKYVERLLSRLTDVDIGKAQIKLD